MPDSAQTIVVDKDTGDWSIRHDGREQRTEPDGTIVIRDRVKTKAADDDDFYRNLADTLDEGILSGIASHLIEGIDSDNQSRQDWLQNAAEAIKLLGLKIEPMRSSGADGAAPLEGMSTAHSPLLLEAVLRGQANASGELLPSAGPVKVKNDQPPRPQQIDGAPQDNQPGSEQADTTDTILSRAKKWLMGDPKAQAEAAVPPQGADQLAQVLETDLNHYLTTTASEYYPDTKRMLFRVYLFGCEFKKVYNCPLRLRPVSESVPANEVIVNNGATDLKNATRVTHRIRMPHSTLVRMQLAKAYRKSKIVQTPSEQPDQIEKATSVVAGTTLFPSLPADHRHTIMECYCELDIQGLEHTDEDGDFTGLPLPYKVSIEYETRQVLEVRRDWDPDLPGLPQRRSTFVKFGFVEGLGFYGLGLMHLLGNTTNTMTSIWRLLLDALMFGNFPGFLYSDSLGKQLTNIFRVPPGAGVPIQLNGAQRLSDVAMPLPYKTPDAVSIQFAQAVETTAQRLGGTADTPVGEGAQNAPVGTTLALIEQDTKIIDAVHKGLHASQSQEFQLLTDRFREDPAAFWRFNGHRKPARAWTEAEFLQALDDCSIAPAADPNTPSQMHRIMRAVARVQLAAMAPPGLVDYRKILAATFRTLGDDPDEYMIDPAQAAAMAAQQQGPPAAPPPDPTKLLELKQKGDLAAQAQQGKMQEMQLDATAKEREQQMRGAEAIVESRDRAADRQGRTDVANARLRTEEIKAQIDSIDGLIKEGRIDPHVGASMISNIQAGAGSALTVTTPPVPNTGPPPPKQQSPGEAMWGPPPDWNRPI